LPFGLSPFGFLKIKVTVRICRRFGLFKMDVDIYYGLSPFQPVAVLNVAVMVCRRGGLLPFWFVAVSACRRFGLSPF